MTMTFQMNQQLVSLCGLSAVGTVSACALTPGMSWLMHVRLFTDRRTFQDIVSSNLIRPSAAQPYIL